MAIFVHSDRPGYCCSHLQHVNQDGKKRILTKQSRKIVGNCKMGRSIISFDRLGEDRGSISRSLLSRERFKAKTRGERKTEDGGSFAESYRARGQTDRYRAERFHAANEWTSGTSGTQTC